MPRKLYQFTVRGTSDFPFDMLRYDHCWPALEGAGGSGSMHLPSGDAMFEPREVTLTGLRPPTEARWNSFMWKVVEGSVKDVS